MFIKRIIFLVFAIFIFILGCKKDDDSQNPNPGSNTDGCLASNLSISASLKGDTVTITAIGGRKPYTYSTDVFNDTIYTLESIFKELPIGTYSFYVKDADGCVKSTKITIDKCLTTNLSISASVYGDTVTITATGGRKPYTYSSDAFNDTVYTSDSIFKELPVGTYSFYVKDADGCVKSAMVTVKTKLPENLKLPLHLSKYFLLTGIWDDGDNAQGIAINFSTDTTWDNATSNYVYTVGNSKWGGGSYLYNNSWTDSLEISPDITKVSFSVKADPGLKLTLHFYPDQNMGKHVAVADGNWHKVELLLMKKTYPTWIKPGSIMNTIWEPANPFGTSVGTKYNFVIKNIVFE